MSTEIHSLKNIAIVAHVDHGKTTMVDVLLKQSGVYSDRDEIEDRVMDSGELEKERGITIKAKNCAIYWKGTKINLLDTPGHADFGAEVERSLMMVDGVLLLVDAAEGPLPQTRFVLGKAMERGIKIGVVINKVDRQDQRVEEVRTQVEDLLLEMASYLNIDDFDIDIPFLYSSARNGWATPTWPGTGENLHCILDFFISDYYPFPKANPGTGTQLLVTNLSYSNYMGQLVVGKIQRGTIEKNKNYVWCDEAGANKNFKVTAIQMYDKLGTREVTEVGAGEIAIVAGLSSAKIGDTICSSDNVEPLPRITIEPPTVSVFVSVSTSPLSGKEGEYLTSRKLEEFLEDSCRHNVALQYVPTDDPKVYELKGRGELQLAIVFEELRRKGNEFMVSRPQVIFRGEGDNKTEPYEKVVLDIPNDTTGAITETLSQRKGLMENMTPIGENRTRMEFIIPSRSLIGYRSKFLTDTRGEGLMSSEFLGYKPYAGDMLARMNGALISDRNGVATPYAIFHLLNNGKMFIRPGEAVYSGMVIGENTRQNDINLNVCREKQLTNVRTAGKDTNIILPPIQDRTLEWALDWIDNDEWVEVTPQNIRVRKKELDGNKRSVIRKGE